MHPVTLQQGINLRLAVGKPLLRNIGLQQTTLGLETLERIVGQLRRQDLPLFGLRHRNLQRYVLHIM